MPFVFLGGESGFLFFGDIDYVRTCLLVERMVQVPFAVVFGLLFLNW